MSASGKDLSGALDRLQKQASQGMRQERGFRAFFQRLQSAAWIPVWGLGAWVVVQVTARGLTQESLRGHWLPWLAASTLLVFLWTLFAYLQASRRTIRRSRALSEWDVQCRLKDRLVAADDFLRNEEASSFQRAAIRDAEAALVRADRIRFDSPQLPNLLLPLLAGSLLLVAGHFASQWMPSPILLPELVAVEAAPYATQAEAGEDHAVELPVEEGVKARPKPEESSGPSASAKVEAMEEGRSPEYSAKESLGQTGSGRSAAAQDSEGASSSQGTPSQQGQVSKPADRKTKVKPKKKKPEASTPQQTPPRKEDDRPQGSTAGLGSSKGSNRNPATSDWSSKDHVNTPDDQDLEEEDEAEDEEEEQEARGGMQPGLRDRRPPVSRDLTIGFGNNPSPDANGRGGPSQPKKSRGTASLVLGVPIPDRVKGHPNPGKTKITQERVQPKAEQAEAVPASDRRGAVSGGAAMPRHTLSPWMDHVVREYFLERRRQ